MPTIKNKTKKAVLSNNAKVCSSIFSKSIGLMFSKKKKSLVFVFEKEKIIPLHMLMVFYPIDVLFLNKSKVVVEMKEKFMPFSFYTPKNEALYIIELPQGIIKKTRTKLGDKLTLR
ncbi:DUF192 domain-containing protein [Candidatus Woesearchaeota archaeon]|nr:DUF192 domain-containing protein [Candidatus Woesearchaeota archaeon]